MKKILIVVIFLCLPLSAHAIAQAPGEVPIYEPLQPAPEGVKPNIEQNTQAGSAEPYWADKQDTPKQTPGSKNFQGEISSEDEAAANTSEDIGKNNIGLWIMLLLMAIAVSIVGYRFYRTSKKYV